jgi:hypothetical protein
LKSLEESGERDREVWKVGRGRIRVIARRLRSWKSTIEGGEECFIEKDNP